MTLLEAPSQRPAGNSRRITPTGRPLLPANAPHLEVLEKRRAGVSSTDVPVITGSATKGTIAEVYYDKTGQLPLERERGGENALWARVLKDAIAAEWAERACAKVKRVGLVVHEDQPWMLTSLDRIVTGCPLARGITRETCGLHIYCRDAHTAPEFAGGALPAAMLDQSLWKLAVTGLDHIHLMVLIGGNDGRKYVVRRSDRTHRFDQVAAACRSFWFENVAAHQRPANTGEERPEDLLELQKRLYRDRGGSVELGEHAALVTAVIDRYEAGRLAASSAVDGKTDAQAGLLEFLGQAQTALIDGVEAFTYKPGAGRPDIDLEQLEEKFPDAYRACVNPGPATWRINIAKAFRHQAAT